MTMPNWLRPSAWHLAVLGAAVIGVTYFQLSRHELEPMADDPYNRARVESFDYTRFNTPEGPEHHDLETTGLPVATPERF